MSDSTSKGARVKQPVPPVTDAPDAALAAESPPATESPAGIEVPVAAEAPVAAAPATAAAAPAEAAGEVTEAEAPSKSLPVRAKRPGQAKAELETVTWVSTKPRGPLSLLRNKLFIFLVLLPTLGSAIYFGLIASDIYTSESRFVIRTPQRTQSPGLVGALLQGTGFSRSQDDAFTVHDYILSRDALRVLDSKHQLRASFASESVDPVNRFPGPLSSDSFESLFKYYTKHVLIDYDTNSSITTLRVTAYTAQDALNVNASLLAMGEKLVNQINERGRQDLIRFASAEVSEAEAKAKAAALAVASYRNQRAVFDPERQSAIQLQQVSKLQDELIATKMQLAQIQALSPQNPQIGTLQKRAKGLETEMATEMAKVAGIGGNSFSNKAADFERPDTGRAFADRQMASAQTSLENARNEARRKQLYLERIVQPSLPDDALEPKRLRNVIATLLMGLVAWGIASMLLAGVKEHQA